MMRVSVEDIQKDFSSCLKRVEAGETLIVLPERKPVAEVKSINAGSETLRPYGLCKGEFTIPDDFDETLPDELRANFPPYSLYKSQ